MMLELILRHGIVHRAASNRLVLRLIIAIVNLKGNSSSCGTYLFCKRLLQAHSTEMTTNLRLIDNLGRIVQDGACVPEVSLDGHG